MQVRKAVAQDAAAIARVHVDAWRTAYRGILADRILDGLSYEFRQAHWHSALTEHHARSFIHVAEDDIEGVVGFVAAGSARGERTDYDGEIFALYVLEAFHGRGIGRELMRHSAQGLAEHGMRSLVLWVLADNPSRGFYQHLGGIQLDSKPITIDGDTLIEVAYGWPEVHELTVHLPTSGTLQGAQPNG